jgi:hypothetical protein
MRRGGVPIKHATQKSMTGGVIGPRSWLQETVINILSSIIEAYTPFSSFEEKGRDEVPAGICQS